MKDFNDFGNLLEIEGRNFLDLQKKLMEIPSKCAVLHWQIMPTGRYKAIVQLDRPSKAGKKLKDQSLSL